MGSTTINFYFDVVFFVYGLSFILLGIVIAVRPKEESRFELAHLIWLLAGFAFIHGALEWMYLWEVVRGDYPTLGLVRPGCLFLSYIFLFEFGRRLLSVSLIPDCNSKWLPILLSPLALFVMLFGILLAVMLTDQKIMALDIGSRYLLGFTGSTMSGFGFYFYCDNRIRPALVASNLTPIRHACYLAAVSFIAYGVFSGLIVPKTHWFPSSWLNQEQFRDMVGVPVQIFRTTCAVLLSLSVTQLLWVFHIETHQRLVISLADTEQALIEVRRLRHRDELILQSVAEGICGFDLNGKIVFINPSALTMLGYTEEELLGQYFDASIAEKRRDRAASDELGMIQKVLHDGQTHWGELSTLHRKDGSSFPVEFRAAPIFDESKLSGAVVTFQDITERKQAQDDLDAQNKTLNAITTSTSNAIVMSDNDGNISFWNKGAETMFGFTSAEAIGQNLHELIAPARFMQAHWDAFPKWQKTGKGKAIGRTLELVGVRKGGQSFPIEISLSSVFLRQRWHAVGIVRDITTRKQEEEILSQAKLAAESANRAKSEFLANMSHEIRTPMNAILGLIQLVLDTPLTTKQEDFLRKAHASSRALLNILNDILDYSKIEAGRLEIYKMPFRVEEPLRDVADLHAAQMAEKGLELFIEIEPEVPQMVIGDAMRLTQVLNNLVGNAVKFTERGEIHVKAEVVQSKEEMLTLRFSVRDTGIGLSKEHIDRLFQAFTQGDSSITRKYGGTGLGLTICQRLVGLMGGEITVSSTEGQGATFVFTIAVNAAPNLTEQPDPHQLENCKILAVDDQETARMILKQVLDAWGLETHTAASGEDALAQIEEAELSHQPFNAVLLDWRMPGMSGLDVARRLQEGAGQGQLIHPLLVVMITAYDKEELLSQAGSIHLDGVLTKPVTPSNLFDALSTSYHSASATPSKPRHAKAKKLPDLTGVHVLLVEDNAINQQVAAEFLKKFNLTVILANHGAEAVDWVKRESFDLVFMDLHMPVMDGLEATRRIHKLPKGQNLPVVAMTAAVMPEDRKRCAACGMVDFVSKPIDPDELTQVLERWVKTKPHGQLKNDKERSSQSSSCKDGLPNSLRGFELGQALNRLDGNRQLLSRLLVSFNQQHADTLTKLDALLEKGETHQAADLLHSLKGVAANLGALDLAQAAQLYELEIKASKPLDSRAAFGNILIQVMEEIATHVVGKEVISGSDELNHAELLALLETIIPYLRECEVIPDEPMLALRRIAQNGRRDEMLVKLIHQIDQFDHFGALASMTKLTEKLGRELPL